MIAPHTRLMTRISPALMCRRIRATTPLSSSHQSAEPANTPPTSTVAAE
jgi:hypothetical protein